MSIATRYERVAQEVARVCEQAGRDPRQVRLVAVSKTVEVPAIAEAIAAGAMDLGENRPDRIMATSAAYPDARWHFIGNIQSRRIRDIVPCASLIHSVFVPDHLHRIETAAQAANKVQDILLEVNVSGEESKGGVTAANAPELLAQALEFPHVRVCGLMTMAPQGDIAIARECFADLRALRDSLNAALPAQAEPLSELSMGMSEDWQCAIEQGATIVRIGRAIFSEEFE